MLKVGAGESLGEGATLGSGGGVGIAIGGAGSAKAGAGTGDGFTEGAGSVKLP